MTRKELLFLIIGQARANGFEFRKWYTVYAARPWTNADDALDWLALGVRANILLFSHPFARAFWKEGSRPTYMVEEQTYQRASSEGPQEVTRRAHTRRSSRDDVWRFHLREMAAAPEPLRYIRRFLLMEDASAAEHSPEKLVLPSAASTPPESETEPNYDDELLVRDVPNA